MHGVGAIPWSDLLNPSLLRVQGFRNLQKQTPANVKLWESPGRAGVYPGLISTKMP